MLQSATPQLTYYLYLEHYPKECQEWGAAWITRELYTGKHRNTIRLFEHYRRGMLSNQNLSRNDKNK